MSEKKMTLYELNRSIKSALGESFPSTCWVIAEISEIKINASGHCYMELIEKDENNEELLAKARATIWAYTFKMLKPYFETSTGLELVSGLKLLLRVSVEFHEYFGLSLNVVDIDPNYTMGDLARRKMEIILLLEKDGVIDMNKNLAEAIVPQRIAIISSETAAGFKDFIHQLENNNHGYKFYYKLFPAYMQGKNAENSIISALDSINENEQVFDVVVIIRGGGSQSDLHCFNNYWLAYHVAQFPLPIITGIGHEKDETVTDMVAHTKLKTPTAVAEYLINKTMEFDGELTYYLELVIEKAERVLKTGSDKINSITRSMIPLAQKRLQITHLLINDVLNKIMSNVRKYLLTVHQKKHTYLSRLQHSSFNLLSLQGEKNKIYFRLLTTLILKYIRNEKEKLNNYRKEISYLDPQNILKRGYSITYVNGNIVRDSKHIHNKDVIITKLYKGALKSEVTDVNK